MCCQIEHVLYLPCPFQVEATKVYSLQSNQEETDCMVIIYRHHAAMLGHRSSVIKTPDTDIFFILLHHAHSIKLTIYLDTGVGKPRMLINVTELAESIGKDYCSSLLGMYVFTGENCTSSFKRKGKVGPLKKLQKYPKYHKVFR